MNLIYFYFFLMHEIRILDLPGTCLYRRAHIRRKPSSRRCAIRRRTSQSCCTLRGRSAAIGPAAARQDCCLALHQTH